MKAIRLEFLNHLDRAAMQMAGLDLADTGISEGILRTLSELYVAAKVEKQFESDCFEVAYHSPVTGELEFLIARILFHFSDKRALGWKILLRRQEKKTAPDIRVVKNGLTIAVIEIKAKAGWMQGFFSPTQYELDKAKYGATDPSIQRARLQLEKYADAFGILPKNVFLLLPTLALVHRKKSATTIDGYLAHFAQISGLPSENLVLLSSNLDLDLSYRTGDLEPTGAFERLLRLLIEITPVGVAPGTEVILSKLCSRCGKGYQADMNSCLDDGTFLSAVSNAFESDARTVVLRPNKKSDRTRANSREFMRQNFPELTQYRVRTSRRYESSERPNYLDDWWVNFRIDELKGTEYLVTALAMDHTNMDFKVLKIPVEYLLANVDKMNVKDGLVNLYLTFDEVIDIRHPAHLPFGQFALN